MTRFRFLATSSLCLSLMACQSLPERTADLAPVIPDNWSEQLQGYDRYDESADETVRLFADNPQFDALRTLALSQNARLDVARANIRAARAQRDVTLARNGAQITTNAGVTAQKLSENGAIPIGKFPGVDTEQILYTAGFDAGWELDLFGRKALRTDIADAQLSLAEEDLRDVQVSLIAELARAWVELQSARAERAAFEASLARQEEILKLTAIKRDHGEASDFNVEQAELQRMQVAAREIDLDTRERIALSQIAVLIGVPLSELDPELTRETPLPALPAHIGMGETTELLLDRSDVRESERRYVLAARELDLKRLDFYPSFRLFGSIGPETTDLSELFSPESLAASLGASLAWTLFDNGERKAGVSAAEARLDGAEASYRASVAAALGDVETSGVRFGEALRSVKANMEVEASAERIADMAKTRYEAGVGNLLDVLSAERDLYDLKRAREASQAQALTNWIALQKALGGEGLF